MAFQEMLITIATSTIDCISSLIPMWFCLFAIFLGLECCVQLILMVIKFPYWVVDFIPKEFVAYKKHRCSSAKCKIVQTFGKGEK